jgi:iron complex outermembrane recepter protein
MRAWIASLLVVCASAALAAADDQATPPPAANRASRGIEEIVVTAQKKAENIQDVPISITALSGDFLKEAAIDDVNKLVHYTPNVYFQYNGPAGSAIFIRGFGTPFALSTLDPGVSLVLDELSIPRDIYMSDPLFDLERFEVLRGPQGTLFGKNTPAGLFNVTTARPTRDFTGTILTRIGGLDTHRFEAAVGGPLGPFGNFAQFRIAALESDGIEDVVNTKRPERDPDVEQKGGRFSLALQPLEGLDALLIGSRATTASPRTFTWQQRHLRPSSVQFLRQYDPRFEDDGFNHQLSQNAPGDVERTTDLIQLNLHQKLPDVGPVTDVEAVAILGKTGFDQSITSDVDMTPADIARILPSPFHYDQRSVELRLSGTAPGPFGWGRLEALLGGLLFDSEFATNATVVAGQDIVPWLLSAPGFETATRMQPPGGVGFQTVQQAAAAFGVTLPPTPNPLRGDGFHIVTSQDLTSKAVFGQLAWHLTDRWTLSFGARGNFEDKNASIVLTCFSPGVLCAANGAMPYTARPKRSESDFSPKITLQYLPCQNLSLFVTRAQGYKSGGFNNLSLDPAGIEVEPEKTTSWEIGAKGDLFDRSLFYGITLFNMDVDNLQLQNFVSTTIVLVRNAASARSRGIELEFRWQAPWEPFSIRGAGALTDAIFTKYPNAPAPRSSSSPNQDLSGKRLPYAPQRQLNATPEIRLPFPTPWLSYFGVSRLVFNTALDILYRGDLFLDGDLDPNTRQDDYVLLAGRLGIANADENLSFNVGVENLTNADVLTFTTDSSFFPGGYMGSQEFQRNYYFELRYRW